MKTDGSTLLNGGSVPLISPDLLSEIVSTAADLTLLVSSSDRIISVLINRHHPSFGRLRHWEGRELRDILTPESHAKVDLRLIAVREGDEGVSQSIELTHKDGGAWEFPVLYTLHRLLPDDSVLMLGRDLRPVAEMQQRLVSTQLALERDYETQREMETRYRVLLEATRDAVVLVSMTTGRIVDLNAAAALKLGAARGDLVGAAMGHEVDGGRRGEFLETITNIAVADAASPVEITARRSKRRLHLVPTVFRAAGERLMLCRLDEAAEVPPVPDDLGDSLARLFHSGVEGIVFTDSEGVIRLANEAFLGLVDAANLAGVRGRSIGDFLARGAIDLKVLLENARRAGQMRLYSTRLTTDFAGQVAVEISATWLGERPGGNIVLVMRDVSRADTVRQGAAGAGADDGMRNVMELVGASPLRDIVAQTADVVEKMCIETAVTLTRNNRVAAAEMLGLSRQSLYVKLRKYGLISRDAD